jgi:hypothetical protein
MKRYIKLICLWGGALFFVLFLISFISFEDEILDPNKRNKNDDYDPNLGSVDDMTKLNNLLNSLGREKGIGPDDGEPYVLLADSIIRHRFYHGVSKYSYSDNFLAFFAGKLRDDIAVMVDPNDILKRNEALCSQNAVVLQEVLKQNGYKVRSVALVEHFCSEVKYDGSWHFYDADYEPIFDASKSRPSLKELMANPEELRAAYAESVHPDISKRLNHYFNKSKITVSGENEFPASNMKTLHWITYILSNFLWVILLGVYALIHFVLDRKKT